MTNRRDTYYYFTIRNKVYINIRRRSLQKIWFLYLSAYVGFFLKSESFLANFSILEFFFARHKDSLTRRTFPSDTRKEKRKYFPGKKVSFLLSDSRFVFNFLFRLHFFTKKKRLFALVSVVFIVADFGLCPLSCFYKYTHTTI